jgi:PKD repeat protein
VASPLTGDAPLQVTFSDTSTGTITSYSWDFGDGGSSTAQNPVYTFYNTGTYVVTLTVSGPGGTSQATASIQVINLTSPHLQLTSICTTGPTRQWRVRNFNPFPVTFDWGVVGSTQSGTATVPAAGAGMFGEIFFDTNTEAASDTVRITVGGVVQGVKASNTVGC